MPELEEREAARFNNYSWREWKELPVQERVECVAYHRLRKLIEMHENEAQIRDAERQRKLAEAQARGK